MERVAGTLYEDARCGFFHDGMFRHRVYIGDYFQGPIAITLHKTDGVIDEEGEIQSVVIHFREFFLYVKGHFSEFVAMLRREENSEAQERFAAACRLKWDFESEPRSIAL